LGRRNELARPGALAWHQVSMILVAIFATVLVSEWVSAKVRHAII
jgi:phosphonate transport system permease protein